MSDSIDPIVERRLSILETQMIQFGEAVKDIKHNTNEIVVKVSSQRGSTAHLEGKIDDILKDMADLQKKVDSLDTVSFLIRNPKIALAAGLGFAFIFVQDFRDVIFRIAHVLFSSDQQ